VKLVGLSTGFNACEATLASGDVNVCLIPEIAFELYGPKGLLNYVYKYVKENKYCLIVVSEGAGKAVQDSPYNSGEDVGEFLK
jgi:6-phosphofructokinase 1